VSRENFRIDWALVRGFGELTILTRASYTLLLLIPVLALAWPVLGSVSKQTESALSKVTTSSEEVLRAIQRTELTLSTLEEKSEANVIKNLTTPIAQVLDNLEKATQETKANANAAQNKIRSFDWRLPKALVQSFLAAAAIFIGQLLYQAFANRITKGSTIDEYESSKKSEYKNFPTLAILEDALVTMSPTKKEDSISAANESLKGKAENVRESMLKTWDLKKVISTYTELDDDAKSQMVKLLKAEESKALALIGLASRKHYRSAAGAWVLCSYVSLAFYSIGIYFILIAFIRQVLEVVRSAKVSSIMDVFSI
jgi:hypothetical protein